MIKGGLALKTVDIITSLLLILLSILGLINTNSFTKDSALVPRIILISILILSAILLIRSIIAKSTERPKIIWDRWIIAVIVTILYIVLIPILGFYISTILYNFSHIVYLWGEEQENSNWSSFYLHFSYLFGLHDGSIHYDA